MFIRRKELADGKRTKVQIVRSVRNGNKDIQRVVRHVGTATNAVELEQFEALARFIIEEIKSKQAGDEASLKPKQFVGEAGRPLQADVDSGPFDVDLVECREESRNVVGVREAVGEVYDRIGWDRLFGARQMSANRHIRELVMARVALPQSKQKRTGESELHSNLSLKPDRVHKSMDLFDDTRVDEMCNRSLAMAQTLLPQPMTSLFYCTTTLFIESEWESDLPEFGYTEDEGPLHMQVVLALLMTPEGLPVGYELFPGSGYEGNTLVDALDRQEQRFPGTTITLVADAALIGEKNRAALEQRGTPYALGNFPMTKFSAEVQQKILDPDGYEAWNRQEHSNSIKRLRSIEDDNSQLVVTWSSRLAQMHARTRASQLAGLRKRLATDAVSISRSKNAAVRFLDFKEGRAILNENRIAEAAKWDGLEGVLAWGCKDIDPSELVVQFRRLAEIETSFATNRQDMKLRPVVTWSDRRVQAHIAICYMAFCCMQHLCHRLTALGNAMDPDRIRRALANLQIGIVSHRASWRKFGMPSKATADAHQIYRALGLTWHTGPFELEPIRR